ncbi:hypothetical protein M0638_25905 [Roseomonas sp. NAR14]|uniref:Uncharacterized protein n=1 Tax=Roseomonas acroporae TaxID=2937791 RepID=A0A9X1YDJ8_9PROT|nr:hypothetical protein [Roseomonas acroporae]MCK8787795.1 hypothetical protein [Roseomonas acroporae]
MSFRTLAAAIGLAAGLAGGGALAAPGIPAGVRGALAEVGPAPGSEGAGIEKVRWANRCRFVRETDWSHGGSGRIRRECRQVWIGPTHGGMPQDRGIRRDGW